MSEEKKVYICAPLLASTLEEIKANMLQVRQHMHAIKDLYGYRTYVPRLTLIANRRRTDEM